MDHESTVEVVILAAGEGKRMKSRLPKVLHLLAGKPLLQHVVDTALTLSPRAVHLVVGHGEEQLREAISGEGLNWVVQSERLGTGHAVLQALPQVSEDSVVVVLCGDVPLIRAETVGHLLSQASDGLAILTADVDDPAGLGRIIRDEGGQLRGVIEDRDATSLQKNIKESRLATLWAFLC